MSYDTFRALGIDANESHTSGSNVGVFMNMVAVDHSSNTRATAASAYYLPHRTRTNLSVLTGATVREILLGRENDQWEALGARFDYEGRSFSVKASREVILCAGSVQSPQLLELSGIGRPDILSRADVELKVSSPNVGDNLQDHLSKFPYHKRP
jgi:choline dehydrogenase-like flavoprotein